MEMAENVFGRYNGEQVYEYTLTSDSGIAVSCLNYGCIINKILVPDRQGKVENVVLGFDRFEDYLEWSPYFGAVVGRVAGRIKGAEFELDGKVLEGPYSVSGVRARNYLGVCLETQGLPDAIHHPDFPTVILNPEEVYYSTTKYRFFSNTIGV